MWNNIKEMWGQFEFVLPSHTLVRSIPCPFQAMWWRHAPTLSKWHKKKTLHMLTHGVMWGCGLTSLMGCITNKFCDIRERNVTIRSEVWTTKIRSLGFQDIRECVTLWRLILLSLGCTSNSAWFLLSWISYLILACWLLKIYTPLPLPPRRSITLLDKVNYVHLIDPH